MTTGVLDNPETDVHNHEDPRVSPLAVQTRTLKLVRRIGFIAMGIQLAICIMWSNLLYGRFALTWDFSVYQQAIWEIWHGNLNPPDTVLTGNLWGNSGQAFFWGLAFVTRIYPHGPVLLWTQDIAVVASEAVVFIWAIEILRDRLGPTHSWIPWIGIFVLLVLFLNPWTYWTLSWDVHSEPYGTLFALLAARAMYHERWKSFAVWSFLTLSGGMIECIYGACIGITGIVLGKSRRRPGIVLLVVSVVWFLLLDFVLQAATHLPTPGSVYGYLIRNNGYGNLSLLAIGLGVLRKPGRMIQQFWVERSNIFAVLSAGGLIGVFTKWGFALPVVLIISNVLSRAFAIVAFQNFPVFEFVTVGTVFALAGLILRGGRWKTASIVVILAVLMNSVFWFSIWAPRTPSQWLRTTPQAAAVLDRALHDIPPNAEVVASQGVAGPFSKRVHFYVPLISDWNIPLYGSNVWFVLTSRQGIELAAPSVTYAAIGQLAGPLHARLVAHGSDVWVFDLHRTPNLHWFRTGLSAPEIPGWLAVGPAGRPVLQGPESTWHAGSTGTRGYVVAYAYWGEKAGTYNARVTLNTSGPVNIEVWNTTSNQLVARRTPPPTNGIKTLDFSFYTGAQTPNLAYSGWGPFQILPNEPIDQNVFEVRVWSPGGEKVEVYKIKFG